MSKKETSYELCKKKTMNTYMKLYEQKKLIIRKKRITSRKQAIAISLQQSDRNCSKKISNKDIKNITNKVSNSTQLNYSDLKRIELLFSKKKDSKKIYKHIIQYLLYQKPIQKSHLTILYKLFPKKL
jgi:hypothetical protein